MITASPAFPDPNERSLTEIQFRGWPALAIRQRELTLIIVPCVGGRLMSIALRGVELAYINQALAGEKPDWSAAQWSRLCGEWSFPLWGGGKTWVAPEKDWPNGAPHRMLDSGAYEIKSVWRDETTMGVELLSPICPESGLQISRRISLDAKTDVWTTRHLLVNMGKAARHVGIWDVLMLRRPGTVRAQISKDWRGRILPFLEKGPLGDVTDTKYVSRESRFVDIHCTDRVEFKVGLRPEDESLSVTQTLPEGTFLLRRRATIGSDADVLFAHGMPSEVFNAPKLDYFEIETHSPLASLGRGKSCELVLEECVEEQSRTPDASSGRTI